ncbi:unnamed protein product [Oikopleura dioica]|uniref:Prohibitin n=1 Tax=Oikopleura dioica TaxID=34765 RepID=E4YSL5_OIKDI|nr:unnamed protein product [Oikopleura dioica]
MATQKLLYAGLGALTAGYGVMNSIYTVDGGHRAVLFSRLGGVKTDDIKTEGMHLKVPWLQWPLIFDIRSQAYKVVSPSGTADLQMVDIGLRVLYRPDPSQIGIIAQTIGEDFSDKVLPSIIHDTLKSVMAQYNASSLLTKRNEVSAAIRNDLEQRARDFNIILDDVAITDTQFSPLFTQSIENKQIAQQQAFQAKFIVQQALEEKKQKIVSAEGEAQSATLIGEALKKNPAYLKLQRIEYGKKVSRVIAQSPNKVMMNTENLLLDVKGVDTMMNTTPIQQSYHFFRY